MLLPNRHASSSNYRYGFQGQEKDDEIKGEGNSLNYKFRMHNPRVGRFFAVDPLARKYPYLTPYQFSSNQPIIYNDPTGEAKILRIVITDRETGKTSVAFVVLDEWNIAKKSAHYNDFYSGDFVENYSWHDINVTQNVILESDGSYTLVGSPTTSIGESVLTESTWKWKAQTNIVAARVDASLPGTDDGMFLMGEGEERDGGGVMFHSKNGRHGAGVRGKNPKIIDYVDGDALLEFLKAGKGISRAGSNSAPGSNNPSTTAPGKWKGNEVINEQLETIFNAAKSFFDSAKKVEKVGKVINKLGTINDKIQGKEGRETNAVWKMFNKEVKVRINNLQEESKGGSVKQNSGMKQISPREF